MNILKKNKTNDNRLPTPEKVKQGFRYYCSLVMALALLGCCTMTAFATTNDPLTVINNLSVGGFGTF